MARLKIPAQLALVSLLGFSSGVVLASPVVEQILTPNTQYQDATRRFDFSGTANGGFLTQLSDGSVSASFVTSVTGSTSSLQKFQSGIPEGDPSWYPWSTTPNSESSNANRVPLLYTNQPQDAQGEPVFTTATWVRLDFSNPMQTFGVEIGPDIAGPLNFTMEFLLDEVAIGSIARSGVEGNGGARLLAASVSGGFFDAVIIRGSIIRSQADEELWGNTSFAIANIRYAVPIPGTLALLSLGLFGGWLSRRRSSV